MTFWRPTIFILGVLFFGFLVTHIYNYGQADELRVNIIDKIGSQALVSDEKNNSSLLTLCVGQKWSSGTEKGFNGLTATSADPQIAVGSFLSNDPVAVNMSIEGKAVGVTRVTFELEVAGIGKALSYFQVTVTGDCGEGKQTQPKNDVVVKSTVSKKEKKVWQFPAFLDRQYYHSGEEPECVLADGDISYDTTTGSRQPLNSNVFYLKLASESWWSNRLQGQFLINKIISSNNKVALANYNKKHGLVIKPQKAGTATITVEAAVVTDKRQKIDQWPKINILVEVPETKMVAERFCPGEKKESQTVEEKSQCDTVFQPKKKSGFTVAAPKIMSKEAEALANKIVAAFKKIKTLPKVCEADVVTRQARKVAEAFYKIPKPPIGRSCVDCAQDVVEVVIEALADEEVACIQITKVGRKMFDVALHTAAVISPPCVGLSENSLVIDTWYFLFVQKIPGVQNNRVYEFYDWINEYGIWWDYIDWGADKSQPNLSMEDE